MRRKKVLIIEDEETVRGAFAAFLEGAGYAVVEAGDGAEGLQQLRTSHVCVVLLDLWMPVMDGLTFRAEQLKDPAIASVPVVVITADHGARQQAADLGINEYLLKPVELRAVLQHVKRYC